VIARGVPMDRYAVVGHPVAHSQSPFIHAEFARQTGQQLSYERVLCPLDGFAETVRRFAGEGARGCNVTVPFKFEAAALARVVSDRARLAGAANVLCFDDEGWSAHNTDGIGLLRDLQVNAAQPLAGCEVLLLGAGGAAAGVLGPLIEARPGRITVANRSIDRAVSLVSRHAALAHDHRVALEPAALGAVRRPAGGFDLLLNAASSSLAGDAAPVPADPMRPGALAVDLMYGAAASGFLRWADGHGLRGRDGLGMLVEQAAEAFRLWRGIRPDTGDVLRRLRERLEAPPPGQP
jgi:shikimate dehydrogenase